MTQKYENLARERDRICARRRLLQAQLDVLDELIDEIRREMELEIGFEDLEFKEAHIEEEK